MDQAVVAYMEAIPADRRALFDRVHRLILDACPDAIVLLSYQMPTYQVGDRRLHVAVWRHGISFYGWKRGGDGGFTDRHPELRTSTGTIRVSSDVAAEISDDEFRGLARSVLRPR